MGKMFENLIPDWNSAPKSIIIIIILEKNHL